MTAPISAGAGRPLKVLYSFPHSIGSPGIGITAYNQVRGLIDAGADVTVYCASVTRPLPAAARVVTTMSVRGQRIPQRVIGGVDRSYQYHDLRAAVALRRGHFDVVHTWPLAALRTAQVARRLSRPVFREVPNTHTADAYDQAQREMTICGIDPTKGYSHRPNPKRLALEEREYAVTLLLVPSDHVADTFLARGFSESVLRRHQYGYDPERFRPEAQPKPVERGLRAVFVGTGEPRKGLHYALTAWRDSGASADGTFVIAGRFVPGYREALGPLLSQPGVTVLDFSDDVPNLMRNSDVLLLPSVEEGSALVTYEAIGSGCVPLVSDAAGAHLQDERSGLIHPARDVERLTQQLRVLCEQPSRVRELRQGALEAAPDLTWRAAGDRLHALYSAELARA